MADTPTTADAMFENYIKLVYKDRPSPVMLRHLKDTHHAALASMLTMLMEAGKDENKLSDIMIVLDAEVKAYWNQYLPQDKETS